MSNINDNPYHPPSHTDIPASERNTVWQLLLGVVVGVVGVFLLGNVLIGFVVFFRLMFGR